MARKRRGGPDAIGYLHDRYVGDDPDRAAAFEAAVADARIARTLYRLRAEAGLTQAELARRVGTTASAISRLESADYRGHSLSMLRRIAAALDRRVEVNFLPASETSDPLKTST